MACKTKSKVAKLNDNGARLRGYRTGYVWWMGSLTVRVNELQEKAHVGPKGPESRKTRRGKRGERSGKFRARRQTSPRAETSVPAPKHAPRLLARVERMRDFCYRIACQWRGRYVEVFQCRCDGGVCTPACRDARKKWSKARARARAEGLHKLLVENVSKCGTLLREIESVKGRLSVSEFLLRKNIAWSRFIDKEEREGPPILVAVNTLETIPKRLGIRPEPPSEAGLLKLRCPDCGRSRVSMASKCGCGYTPVRRVPFQVIASVEGSNSRGSARRGAFRGAVASRGRAPKRTRGGN
jgi:hypothetical protein